MQLTFQRPLNSIQGPIAQSEIADFIVLTGPNGAGKSNLLAALVDGSITIEGVSQPTPQIAQPIRIFRLNELVTQAEGAQSPAAYRERYLALSQQVVSLTQQFQSPQLGSLSGDALEDMVRNQLVDSRQIGRDALEAVVEAAGRKVIELEVSDFRKYAPLLIGIRDPFALSIAEVFLSYHQRRNSNDRDQWLAATKGRADVTPLTDDEFIHTYGAPPWESLNDALKVTGLPYAFVPPEGTEDDLPYEPRLRYLPEAIDIRVDQLSSGERTLLAIALSLFTGTTLEAVTQLPQVLLLDEVDASLHPAMVESLLRVVNEIFVVQHNVKVILTTHAPTTVALAPEQALYVMHRHGFPRLRKASRDEALSSLTVGLPTLSVRVQNRRQVFVESEYDQECYQTLFELLRPDLASPFSLTFIASSKGKGGNSSAVTALVSELRSSGNDLVWGLVDRDTRMSAPEWVAYNANRYAIENLLLDPLGLAVFLMRNHRVDSADLGLGSGIRHFELNNSHSQHLVDSVVSKVTTVDDDSTPVPVTYMGGFTANVPRYWLNINGHDLESRIKDAYPMLNAERNALMLRVTTDAYRDVRAFVPDEARILMQQLLA